MKVLCALLFALVCSYVSANDHLTCSLRPTDIDVPWRDMVDPCIKLMEGQVKIEMHAAMTYMAMGAYFAQDTVNRPGFSKLFFESANEERGHAIEFIKYLLMRGQLTEGVSHLLKFPVEVNGSWSSGMQALTDALTLEANVTREIRNIIATCESPKSDNDFNDYHLVDHLIGVFLDEQYKGERVIAERISTLGKMVLQHGALAEFMFDKKLLKNEV